MRSETAKTETENIENTRERRSGNSIVEANSNELSELTPINLKPEPSIMEAKHKLVTEECAVKLPA